LYFPEGRPVIVVPEPVDLTPGKSTREHVQLNGAVPPLTFRIIEPLVSPRQRGAIMEFVTVRVHGIIMVLCVSKVILPQLSVISAVILHNVGVVTAAGVKIGLMLVLSGLHVPLQLALQFVV
jgi:hypothetical protein